MWTGNRCSTKMTIATCLAVSRRTPNFKIHGCVVGALRRCRVLRYTGYFAGERRSPDAQLVVIVVIIVVIVEF